MHGDTCRFHVHGTGKISAANASQELLHMPVTLPSPHRIGQPCINSPTCEPVTHALILDLPDARAFCVDIADGRQLVCELCLLGTEADGMGVLGAQRLRLTVHLHSSVSHQSAVHSAHGILLVSQQSGVHCVHDLLLVSQLSAACSANRLISQPTTSCKLY